MTTYRLPGKADRISIYGRTGSGKTVAAVYHLSKRDFTRETWVALNHKNSRLLNEIPGAHFLALHETPPPGRPGLYVYNPIPEKDDDAVTALLWRIHQRGGIGVYIDEGYMISSRDPALIALYTQGRELGIPMITLSQRPTRICRFGVSEADFHQVFHLVDRLDRKRLSEFVPYDFDPLMAAPAGQEIGLPPHHSVYYDVARNQLLMMLPVPDEDSLLEVFADKLIPATKKNNLL